MSDDEFLAALTDCSLPAADFGHRGHLRLARICLRRHDTDQAVARCCALIRAYATHLGAPGKFNWTLTACLVRLLASEGQLADARASVARHYSPALLASAAARSGFVAPDLAPLPA